MILIILLSLILASSVAQINSLLTQEYANGTLIMKVVHDQPFQILFRVGEVQLEGVIQCHMCKCRSKFSEFSFIGCQVLEGLGHYDLRWVSVVPKSEAFLDDNLMSSYFGGSRLLQTNLTSSAVDVTDMSSRLNMTSDFTIWWKFNNDTNQTFDMVIRWNRGSWLGIGLGPDMDNTDMWIFYQSSSDPKVQVIDAWSTGEQTPSPDQKQSLTVVSYNQSDQGFFIRIRRQLNSQDNQDAVLQPGSQYTWCFAYSGARTLEMHSEWFRFIMTFSNGIDQQAEIFNSGDPQFYAHAIILFISWGVIADIGVFVARFFKNVNGYINIHTLCFLLVDFGTIIIGIIMLTREYQPGVVEKKPGEVHEILAIILIGLVLLQHIAGVVIKVNIEASVKANKQFVISMKKFHGISGTIIYTLAKVTMLLGFISNKKVVLLILYLIWILILILVRIALEIRRRKYRLIQTKVASSTQKLNHKQFTLINLLTQNTPTADIIKELPDVDWVVLNYDVYDMTGYQHPGGNFIIKSCQGREISRFFYGAYGLENTTMKRHKHSQQAIQSLDSRYIGTLVKQPDAVKEETSANANQWNKVDTLVLSENISQFQYQRDGKQFNLIQNLQDFGQHFTVSFSDIGGKVRMYTKVLSMSSPCVQFRKDLITFYDQFEQGKADRVPVLVQKVTDTLPLIIKKYNYPKALSKQIFELNSPAQGLELKPDGKNIAFIGGTGILPFIDLLDFLFKYTIHQVISQKNKGMADQIFNQENQIQSTFGFKLCASFLNEEEFVGKDFIRKMYQINKQHNLHIFDMEIRYSNGKLDSVIPQITNRFSQQYVQEQSNNADKIYVCGPPTMNYSVLQTLENLNVDQSKIVIV